MKLRGFILMLFVLGITFSLSAQDVAFYYKYAEKGDKEAMYNLGNCFLYGTGVQQNDQYAVGWFMSAAKKKYPPAQAALARCYLDGIWVIKDYRQAYKLAEKAAKKGCAAGYYVLSQIYKNGGGGYYRNDNYYLRYLRTASNLGDGEAQSELGYMYLFGNDKPRVEENMKMAIDLFNKAAANGDGDGYYMLGLLYDGGVEGYLDDDPEKAFQYMSLAVQKKISEAYCDYGRMKLYGIGCDEDYEVAYRFISYAANEEEDDEAYLLMGDIYNYGYGVEEDDAEAVKWYQKAVDAENEDAYSKLADMYLWGYGVKENYSKAFQLYKKAADADDKYGYFGLAICYESGYGTAVDMVRAASNYEKVAAEDDGFYSVLAKYQLYYIYSDGDGVAKNTSKAIQYLREAADDGYPAAQYSLGFEYGVGEILHREDSKALEYITMAADNGYLFACAILGCCYYSGEEFCGKNFNKAFYYMNKVAESNGYGCSDETLSVVYRNLGACYRFGRGTAVDNDMASYYTNKAAEYGDEDSLDIVNMRESQTNQNVRR